MDVMVCIDDHGGMRFNHRRQSRDKVLRARLLARCEGRVLWMNRESARQFGEPLPPEIRVDEDFLRKAGPEEVCFVEAPPLLPWADSIGTLYLYRWNRVYPADEFFDLPLAGWSLVSAEDFPGNSHEKITEEVYRP